MTFACASGFQKWPRVPHPEVMSEPDDVGPAQTSLIPPGRSQVMGICSTSVCFGELIRFAHERLREESVALIRYTDLHCAFPNGVFHEGSNSGTSHQSPIRRVLAHRQPAAKPEPSTTRHTHAARRGEPRLNRSRPDASLIKSSQFKVPASRQPTRFLKRAVRTCLFRG